MEIQEIIFYQKNMTAYEKFKKAIIKANPGLAKLKREITLEEVLMVLDRIVFRRNFFAEFLDIKEADYKDLLFYIISNWRLGKPVQEQDEDFLETLAQLFATGTWVSDDVYVHSNIWVLGGTDPKRIGNNKL